MKISASRLPEEGLKRKFTEQDDWVKEKLQQNLPERYLTGSPVQGHFRVFKTLNNLQFDGEISLDLQCSCDRCTQPYRYPLKLHCERILVPLFESKRQKEIEKSLEVEVTADDLDFSYYEKDEIDLGDIFTEEILLHEPLTKLCRPDCKGLCPQCGINRNEGNCACKQTDLQKSPFAKLGDWMKGKNKKG